MRIFNLVFLLFLFGPCTSRGQTFKLYNSFEAFEERLLEVSKKTTVVVNFWATWCGPCVEELPCFDELYQKYAGPDVQIWLVSLNFKSQLEKQFVPFLNAKQLKGEVILLADQDYDAWIKKVHPDWEGALPGTLLIRDDQRAFHTEPFENFQELENFILQFLKTTQNKTGMSNGGTR